MIPPKLHYMVWAAFKHKVYGDTLNNSNFYDDGKLHHQELFYEITEHDIIEYYPTNIIDKTYVKLQKGNDYYLLPARFINQMPIIPVDKIQVHLKKTETQVWNYIQRIETLKIPIKKCYEYRDLINMYNPINHTVPKTNLFLKFITLAQGEKLALCGIPGSGKNCHLTILSQMINGVAPKVKTPTLAKFYRTIFYNDKVNIDELTSWKPSEVQVIEDICAELSDEAPEFNKFSLDSNKLLETISNANNKSLTFTFNPKSDHNKYYFHEMFKNYDKIERRFPILYLPGKINDYVPRPTQLQITKQLKLHFETMCNIVSTIMYYKDAGITELKNFTHDNLQLKGVQVNNITPVLNQINLYCRTQSEYTAWINWINARVNEYKVKAGLMQEVAEVSEEQVQ